MLCPHIITVSDINGCTQSGRSKEYALVNNRIMEPAAGGMHGCMGGEGMLSNPLQWRQCMCSFYSILPYGPYSRMDRADQPLDSWSVSTVRA